MGGERNGPSFGESGTNDRNFPESFMKCMQPSFAVDLPSNGFPTPKRSLPKFVPGVFLSFLAGRQGLCASTLHFYRANLFISQKKTIRAGFGSPKNCNVGQFLAGLS